MSRMRRFAETGGVMGEECLGMLQSFFREAREKAKREKKAD